MADPWSGNILATVKVVHVLFAAAWVGHGIFMNAVLMPTLLRATPQAQRELMGRLSPASLRFGNMVGGFTLLSGLALAYGMTGSFEWTGTWGKLVYFALVGNLMVLYLLNFALRPSLRVIGQIMAQQTDPALPPPQTVRFLQKRLAVVSVLTVFILVLVLVAMVLANTHVLD